MVRALNGDLLVWYFSSRPHLLNLRHWLLLLLARLLEFHQCYSFRYTYCMYMHKINIMGA
jgi:hypothetical protein